MRSNRKFGGCYWTGHEDIAKASTQDKRDIMPRARSAFGRALAYWSLVATIAGLGLVPGSSAQAWPWRALLATELRQFGLIPPGGAKPLRCCEKSAPNSSHARGPAVQETSITPPPVMPPPPAQPPPVAPRNPPAQLPCGDNVKPAENWTPADAWAWCQIQLRNEAKFDERCDPFDPNQEDDQTDTCRELSAGFLQDILTRAPWQEKTPARGVLISNASIKGNVDLENAKLLRPIEIKDSRFYSGINLNHAQTDFLIALDGSRVDGNFTADGLASKIDLDLNDGLSFKKGASLNHANIGGRLDLTDARFDGLLNATGLEVGGSLLMGSTGRKKLSPGSKVAVSENYLAGENRAPAVEAFNYDSNSRFNDPSRGSYPSFMSSPEYKVSRNSAPFFLQFASLSQASDVQETLSSGITPEETLPPARFKGVLLNNARIRGKLDMHGAIFNRGLDTDSQEAVFLNADSLAVDGDLFMNRATYAGKIAMVFAHVGGNLDLRGASLSDLNLSGASIMGDLRLGSKTEGDSCIWEMKDGRAGHLNLRNAHLGGLADPREAWPEESYPSDPKIQSLEDGPLELEGFTFAHVRGFDGERWKERFGNQEKKPGLWDNWARLDHNYSPGPYTQLANYFVTTGDHENANKILYRGRVRERETQGGFAYVWSGLLQNVAGFGIGNNAFVVLVWVFGFCTVGMIMLKFTVQGVSDENHGLIWCFGASLSRLLPVIDINEDIKDFYKNPMRNMFEPWQNFFFSLIGIVGWILAAILAAAVSGITHNS
jgi:hypothetical protein